MIKYWTLVASLAMLLSVGQIVKADENPAAKTKEPEQAKAAEAPKPSVAQLQAQLHRTMAALIEARTAEKPDQAQIDKLVAEARSLRQQLVARATEVNAVAPCPWGGPGFGPGRGYGRGYGWGAGYGRGPGYGRGAGWGAANGVPGRGFIDRDGDGVCDNYELRQNQ